jgi:hypothetical protein
MKEQELIKTISKDFGDSKVEIKFYVSYPLKMTYEGPVYPKTTHCVIGVDGQLKGLGIVSKHNKDEDNQQYAINLSAKRAFEDAFRFNRSKRTRQIRTELWEEILNNQ